MRAITEEVDWLIRGKAKDTKVTFRTLKGYSKLFSEHLMLFISTHIFLQMFVYDLNQRIYLKKQWI